MAFLGIVFHFRFHYYLWLNAGPSLNVLLGLTVAHAFASAFAFDFAVSVVSAFGFCTVYLSFSHSVCSFCCFFALVLSPSTLSSSSPSSSSSSCSSRTTPTTLPTSCYRANFRCFILTQWCTLKARWANFITKGAATAWLVGERGRGWGWGRNGRGWLLQCNADRCAFISAPHFVAILDAIFVFALSTHCHWMATS